MAITMVGFFLVSCSVPSLKGYGDDVLKHSRYGDATIEQMKKAVGVDSHYWEMPSYYLPNGNAVYVEPTQRSTGCDYHWEVNPEGSVVGYRTVGPSCKKHGGIEGWRRWTGTGIEQFPDRSQ
jgi:hypothetical protein